MRSRAPTRIEFGDWQTPDELAHDVVAQVVGQLRFTPQTILEPTCGQGAFLVAAHHLVPNATLAGYEINPAYVTAASARLPSAGQTIQQANFFAVDWEREIEKWPEPLLVLGNPPWVTSAGLGVMGSDNLPQKQNFKRLHGLDARTGKSNFDVSEWMILRLLQALSGRNATLAMLCKSAVARRVVEFGAQQQWNVFPGGVWRIDAGRHFHAAVDAVLFVCHTGTPSTPGLSKWPVYAALDTETPESHFGVADGELVADLDAYQRSRAIAGRSNPEWRSGIKHDCADVMELKLHEHRWTNGLGEIVDIEPRYCFPLLKSSDVANGRTHATRAVIVPQRAIGDDTRGLEQTAPKLWAYLSTHADKLADRKSSIYRGQPPFAIFGVGAYSFAPWKVAISGLYKRLRFCVLGPHQEQPVMLDDTCYFLPFAAEVEARAAASALESEAAGDFFRGRVFWDAKRPINKAILQNLDMARLIEAHKGARFAR